MTNEQLKDLSLDELRDLNKRVCAEIRHRHNQTNFYISSSLRVGEKVSFNDKYGIPIVGSVTKINLKSVKVQTNRGIWNVSPTLLKRG